MSPRPRTAVLHQWVGMGDLVWHVPYFRLAAQTSADGQVSVIASPTTFARDLIGHEPWVREIIDFDRHPRLHEQRSGRHRGVAGLFRMGGELRVKAFERILLFTHHGNRAITALHARIPTRLGYGSNWLQRLLLTRTPWIKRYRGQAAPAYKDASAFAMAQGWCDAPVVPRLVVRPDALERMQARLAGLPRPLHALSIGSSEPYKQWGAANFAELAILFLQAGHGVLLLGGPAEREIVADILARIPPSQREGVHAMTDGSVADTVAACAIAQDCTGNDTGAANIAAAVATPTWVILGPRPALEHDPAMLQVIVAPTLAEIRPAEVAARVLAQAPRAAA